MKTTSRLCVTFALSMIVFSTFAQEISTEDRLVLQMVAMKRVCITAYPNLRSEIEAHFFSGPSGLGQKMRALMESLESNSDPRIIGRIEGAASVFSDQVGIDACKSIAGVKQ